MTHALVLCMDHLPSRAVAPASDPSSTDEELLARMASGDRLAMGRLYDLHAPALRRIGVAILRSKAEAEDALHDLFVKVSARSHQYDLRFGSVRSWLSAAMRNACIDRLRWHARGQRAGDEVKTILHAQGRQEATTMTRAIDGQRAMHAKDTLPLIQRRTIESLYCEEMSCTEVAKRDRVPVGTVKSRASRAIMALRSDLLGVEERSGRRATEEAA
jgi:RNA polymerase sigma-70 factor, ECF subfamily